MEKLVELSKQHLSINEINSKLVSLSIQKVVHNPFQYVLLATIEGLRMFFWESTQVGFVSYPHWLQKIYDIKIFNNALRFLVSLLSLIAVMSIWSQALTTQKYPIDSLIAVFIVIYIFLFSFVCTLTRYAIPIAPLYLIAIGVWINQNLIPKKTPIKMVQ
jgi:hypothetical protein